jgi:hypothetical protein
MRKKIQRLLDEIESEYRFTRGMTGKAMLGSRGKASSIEYTTGQVRSTGKYR